MERQRKKAAPATNELRDWLEVEIDGPQLDAGSYNGIYATNDPNRVLRVFQNTSEKSIRMFLARRAVAFHQLFQMHETEMGPSNLKVYSTLVKLAETSYAIEMERLSSLANEYIDDDQQLQVNLFSLIWWLENAHSIFEYVHRDVKPANIMYREYKTPQNMCFDSTYVLRNVRKVPVIFDFDASRVRTTQRNLEADQHMTPIYGPPETAIVEFGYKGNSDWWALGVSTLYWLVPDIRGILYIDADNYIQACHDALVAYFDPDGWNGKAFDPSRIRVVLVACILNHVLNAVWKPPADLYPPWYECFIHGKEHLLEDVFRTPKVIQLKAHLDRDRVPRRMLKRCFSWIPQERVLRSNDPWFDNLKGFATCKLSYTHHQAGSPPKFESEYMKCLVCERIAHRVCGIGGCLTLYCSDGCAEKDWDAHKHH